MERDKLVTGMVLIVIGAALLFAQFSPNLGRYVVAAIGLVLLGLFLFNRQYGLLIGGCIVTGVGVGIVLASSLTGDLAGAGFLLSLGGGFLAIFVLSYLFSLSERHWWPLVPGGILSTIGAAVAVGEDATRLLDYWPIVLIVIGVILLLLAFMRREPGRVPTAGAAEGEAVDYSSSR